MMTNLIRRSAAFCLILVGALLAHSDGAAQDATAPAYVFVQSISVTDRAAFERYQALARDAITKHAGRFLARVPMSSSSRVKAMSRPLACSSFPAWQQSGTGSRLRNT